MDHIWAGRGLRLTYVRDPVAIDDIVQVRDHTAAGGTLDSLALAWAVRRRQADVNHVVLATDCRSGRRSGFLVAHDGKTEQEPFLLLDVALSCSPTDRAVVLRRMVALTVLRSVALGRAPSVIAVRTRLPALCRTLSDLSARVAGSSIHPRQADNVVRLTTAALAHRVARAIGEKPRFDAEAMRRARRLPPLAFDYETEAATMAVLDLRLSHEDALIEGARWLYRARRPRRRPGVDAPAPAGVLALKPPPL